MPDNKQDVKISKMVIQLSDDKISLSMEDAKKLHAALDALFGKKAVEKIVEEHHHHHSHYDYWWYRPYKLYDNVYLGGGVIAKELASENLGASNLTFTAKADTQTLFCNLAAVDTAAVS